MDILKELTELRNKLNFIDISKVMSIKVLSDSITDDNEFPIVEIIVKSGLTLEDKENIKNSFQNIKSEFTYEINEYPTRGIKSYTLWNQENIY